MNAAELLDQIIARLATLRDHGVTHVSVDPTSGAVSMLLAPKPPEASPVEEQKPRTWDPGAIGLSADAPEPRSFRDRLASTAPVVK